MKISYNLQGSIIPDAWLLFENLQDNLKSPVLLEIDRGTAYREKFKEHVKSRIEFLHSGEYQKIFDSKGCTIAYATTGKLERYKGLRLEFMVNCARDVLKEMNLENWGIIFHFGPLTRKTMFKEGLFEGKRWYRPGLTLLLSSLATRRITRRMGRFATPVLPALVSL